MPIGQIIYVILMIISTVLSIVLQPKPMIPKLLPGEITNVPIAEYGKPIPVVFGKRYLRQPNVVWWGKPQTRAIKKKIGSKS